MARKKKKKPQVMRLVVGSILYFISDKNKLKYTIKRVTETMAYDEYGHAFWRDLKLDNQGNHKAKFTRAVNMNHQILLHSEKTELIFQQANK